MPEVIESTQVRGGDFLAEEGAGPMITRESRTIDNSAGLADLVVEPGTPMLANALVLATAEATADAFVIGRALIPKGLKQKVAVIARGPAAVNGDRFPSKDKASTNYNVTALKARAVVLGLVIRYESPTQVQT